MTDIRQQFQSRFAATATDRLRRALAALHADPAVVYHELHGLAGEAGIMGFAEISTAAAAGLELARTWRTTKPTGDQQLQCARILRSLMGLVGNLQRTATAPQPAAPPPAPAVRRALVIEDSELIAEELADALRDAGFEASTAATMDAALASARSAPPSVVLVDVNIPGVEFRTLCARIREHAANAKMLVVSASTEDELRRYAQEVGADGYVGKLRGTPNIIAYITSLFASGAS
jgi:CheY-like chemotaxis protein